jgi:hypothetical protein
MTRTQTNIRREEVIQWVFRTKRFNVPIAELASLSALKNRNFSSLKVTPMSRNAVPAVGRQGEQSGREIAATGLPAKCSPRHAPSVVRIPRYLSNLEAIDRCTVVIATEKSDRLYRTV